MSYIGFILHTIYTHVIWMKVFFERKRNGFYLKTPCFLWFASTFCPEFCFILSEETELFLFSWDSFLLSLFFGCSLEFLSATIDSAYRGVVFDLEIPPCFLLHTKPSIYHIFPVYFSLSWETKARCSGDINISIFIFCSYSFFSFV